MLTQLSNQKIEFFQLNLINWGSNHFVDFPWRYTENHWHALAAEIMLQRTNANQVINVYKEFCEKYPSPEDYIDDKAPNTFNSLGLKWREELLQKLAYFLTLQEIPKNKKELIKLPGVGEYIAAAFLSLHLNIIATIIDSNVVRVYGRFFGFPTDSETRRKKWFIEFANKLTPLDNHRRYNYAVIDFTREICRPKPQCHRCLLNKYCSFNFREKRGEK
ncbi:hypothetical protein [Halobacillus sp. A5]|uniref:hypothetical protein n=1 Tax=Halobacillus sp. A5 TaxID=2880263 RepID=UPI0020A6283D|nr:hypothetical protein [Halobacillus sp. A5]MCP3029639.1 hypothetical protein [Halobacillus sp. A5]